MTALKLVNTVNIHDGVNPQFESVNRAWDTLGLFVRLLAETNPLIDMPPNATKGDIQSDPMITKPLLNCNQIAFENLSIRLNI